jgi:hypothetical protein
MELSEHLERRSVDNRAAPFTDIQVVASTVDYFTSSAAAVSRELKKAEGKELSYKMVAERDNETVRIDRDSVLVVVAKARVWASEGWHVKIIDADGTTFAAADLDSLLAAA